MVDTSPPLNQAFVDRLRQLASYLAWHVARGADADRGAAARRSGGASVFEGHRGYIAGDDPRAVDWNAFARSDQLVVKLFRRDTEAVVDVLLDRSASMATGENARRSLQLAAAFCYLGLTAGHRVRFAALGEDACPLTGAFDGVTKAAGCLAALGAVRAPAGDDFVAGLRAYASRVPRPGAVVIVTDGLAAAGLERLIARFGRTGGEVALFQTLAADDFHPALAGPVTLEDAERGDVLTLDVDAPLLVRYRSALGERIERLERACGRAGVEYHFVDPSASIEETVIDWHRRRSRRVV